MEERPFAWMDPRLEVRPTAKYGRGVYAKKDIKKDEVLFVIGGYVLTIEDENGFDEALADKPMEVSEYFSIGPLHPSQMDLLPSHIVNHSCDPNVGFDGQIFMVAYRDIRKDEELVYDYAMSMHSHHERENPYSLNCMCGSSLCRGTVTEDDWKLPELQERYDGYFQHYLQKKIRASKKESRAKELARSNESRMVTQG